MTSYICILRRTLLLATLLVLIVQTPSLAGMCKRQPPMEEQDHDILLIQNERLIDKGEAEKDKPIRFSARVIEVLRGDSGKYADSISVSIAPRQCVGFCSGRAEYSVMSVPKSGDQFIASVTGTTSGAYTLAFPMYSASPYTLNRVKTRIKELSSVNSNFEQEARRVDVLKAEQSASLFYKECLDADLSPVAKEATDVIVTSAPSYLVVGDAQMEFTASKRLRDSGTTEARAVKRPVYVARCRYNSNYSKLYDKGCIIFLKATPTAAEFKPPKNYPQVSKEAFDNDRFLKKTFVYYPAAEKLWMLPSTPEMLAKVQKTLQAK